MVETLSSHQSIFNLIILQIYVVCGPFYAVPTHNIKRKASWYFVFSSVARETESLRQIFICWLSHQHDRFPLSLSSPLSNKKATTTHFHFYFHLSSLSSKKMIMAAKKIPNDWFYLFLVFLWKWKVFVTVRKGNKDK